MDDMILLSTDRGELVRARAEIERFLRERLRLELRAEGQEPFRVGRGIDFVGWKTWWDRRLPRRRTLGNLNARLDAPSSARRCASPGVGGRSESTSGALTWAGERCLVFCQVGRFVEFRGPQRAPAEGTVGLRRAYLPRAGYAFAVGFPLPLLAIYKTRAIECGLTVVDVRERTGPSRAGGKVRVPVAVLTPVSAARPPK